MKTRHLAIALATLLASCSTARPADDGVILEPEGTIDDPYEASLKDPANLLTRPTPFSYPADSITGGTLKHVISSDPKGFNWLLENSVDVRNIQHLMHNSVARRDFENPNNFVPELAHKVTVNDDYTEYTIHIRKGVMWQTPALPDIADKKYDWLREPHELTAHDFKFYIDMVLNSQVESGAARNYYADIKEVKVLDDYTYKIIWKKKTQQSFNVTLESYPMPKWLFTKNPDGSDIPEATLGLEFNKHWSNNYPIGTGAYRFAKFEKGKALELKRNPNYFGAPPRLDRIRMLIASHPEDALEKLLKGDTDVAFLNAQHTRDPDLLKSFKNNGIRLLTYDVFGYTYIGWNASKPMFADKRVRQALTHAFRREEIIATAFHGLGSVQTGPFVKGHPANNPAVEAWPYDLEKAKSLLTEAGWTDTDGDGIRDKVIDGTKTKFVFTITAYAGSPEWDEALSIFKEDLRAIGVVMDFSPVGWPTMQKKMNEKKFDAFTGGWGLDWAIDPYQLWHSSQADIPKGSNRVGFRNERADEIIEELRETFDEDTRLELAREFHAILHDEQPYTFFRAPQNMVAVSPRVAPFTPNRIRPQIHPLRWSLTKLETTP
jgi:ABC-type transport system substrate-binding protein